MNYRCSNPQTRHTRQFFRSITGPNNSEKHCIYHIIVDRTIQASSSSPSNLWTSRSASPNNASAKLTWAHQRASPKLGQAHKRARPTIASSRETSPRQRPPPPARGSAAARAPRHTAKPCIPRGIYTPRGSALCISRRLKLRSSERRPASSERALEMRVFPRASSPATCRAR